jgi:hypothetical protein
MSPQSIIVAAFALLATANAHIKITQPVPFSKDTLDTAPISKKQFPCKNDLGYKISTMNTMAVGSKQTLQFSGTAVHGGGSCQLSITTDPEPTEKSIFKVIKSIEGGCPGVDGTTNTYDFQLPASIPNGKATFAWTWFSKMSGAPELYMNCAPIEVTGGASDKTAFNALPDMLVANIGGDCTSPQNFATKFPNPGLVVQEGTTNDQKPPTGNCGSTGTTPTNPSAPAGQPSAAPQSSAAAGQPSAPAAQSSTAPVPSAVPSASPVNPGGVFAPGASSAAPVQSTMTTLVTVTAAPGSTQPTAPASPGNGTVVPAQPSPAQPTPAQPSSAPSTGGGSSGTTCSQNGAVVCNGPTQFGLCNNGNVVWQAVAAGTTCTNGVISKRAVYNDGVPRPRYRSPRAIEQPSNCTHDA